MAIHKNVNDRCRNKLTNEGVYSRAAEINIIWSIIMNKIVRLVGSALLRKSFIFYTMRAWPRRYVGNDGRAEVLREAPFQYKTGTDKYQLRKLY